jgi:hypothetical protein
MQQERVEEPQLQEEQYNRYNIKKIKTTTHQATENTGFSHLESETKNSSTSSVWLLLGWFGYVILKLCV